MFIHYDSINIFEFLVCYGWEIGNLFRRDEKWSSIEIQETIVSPTKIRNRYDQIRLDQTRADHQNRKDLQTKSRQRCHNFLKLSEKKVCKNRKTRNKY